MSDARQASSSHRGPWIDEFESVLAVLLAIVVAHLIGARNISWAAFSAYMVMRGHVADSLLRGTLRMLGTALGAALALLIVPAVQMSWPMSSLAAAIVGGVSLYLGLTARHAYGWLFTGLTFEMILLDKLGHPSDAITGFATTRFLEVVAGTSACILVSILSALTVRRRWPGVRAATPPRIGWHPRAAQHSAQGALALALLPLAAWLLGVQDLAQGAISIMAAMLVPIASLETKGLVSVSVRLMQRIVGCLIGGALSALLLFAAKSSPPILIAGTAIGVFIGRHIENSGRSFAYVGNQFTLAVLVTLVPDSYAHVAIAPALDRLYGILLGVALLEPVLIAWRIAAAIKAPVTQALTNGGSGVAE